MKIKITNRKIEEMAQRFGGIEVVLINIKTGEIKYLMDLDKMYIEDYEGLIQKEYDKIAAEKEDWIRLKNMNSKEEFQIMESFIPKVRTKKIRDQLLVALSGYQPSRTFKDQIHQMALERDEWFEHRTRYNIDHIRDFLEFRLKDTDIELEEDLLSRSLTNNDNIAPPSYGRNSIRTFIGAKDFNESRQFYIDLGFIEIAISEKMSFFTVDENMGFYLQKYFVKDWIDNSMVFLEVDDVEKCYADLSERKLHEKYTNVRLTPIKNLDWGSECFLHDPSGVLWHFGESKK